MKSSGSSSSEAELPAPQLAILGCAARGQDRPAGGYLGTFLRQWVRLVRGLCTVNPCLGEAQSVFGSSVRANYRLRLPRCLPIVRALFKKTEFMRRPKGIKTKKSVAKRFKITATGKVLRSRAGRRHLCQGKSPKRRRGLRGSALVHETDAYRIKQNLPFSH